MDSSHRSTCGVAAVAGTSVSQHRERNDKLERERWQFTISKEEENGLRQQKRENESERDI